MNNIESFKNTLDQEYNFPCEYLFKFIVKNNFKEDVISLLPEAKKNIKISPCHAMSCRKFVIANLLLLS